MPGLRTHLHTLLTADVDDALKELVADRVYQRGTLDGRPEPPYIVHSFSPRVPELTGLSYSQTAQVWVHDDQKTGYDRIDLILDAVKLRLRSAPSVDNFIAAEFIEDSSDLPPDPSTNTIARFGRYQFKASAREEPS